MMRQLLNSQPTVGKRLGPWTKRMALISAAACLLSLTWTTSWLYADTITITATIYNSSSQTVTVTVRGFKQGTSTKTMRPGTKWGVSMKSNDNSLAITAKGPVNTIESRVGNRGSKSIANDPRPKYIKWDRR